MAYKDSVCGGEITAEEFTYESNNAHSSGREFKSEVTLQENLAEYATILRDLRDALGGSRCFRRTEWMNGGLVLIILGRLRWAGHGVEGGRTL